MLFDPNWQGIAPIEALTIFYKLDALEIVQESLLHSNYTVVFYACDFLIRLSSKEGINCDSSIPYLIKALEGNNFIESGGDKASVHRAMKSKLIMTIKEMTDLDINIKNELPGSELVFIRSEIINDPQQIEIVISKAKDWAKKHTVKLLDEK